MTPVIVKPIRYSLAVKIMVLLLGLATFTIMASALLSFFTVHEIKHQALAGNQRLGAFAEESSTATLTRLAEDDLKRRANQQAEMVDGILNRIGTIARGLALVAGRVQKEPRYDVDRPGDTVTVPPMDVLDRSSFVLAPGVELDSVRSELNRTGELDHVFAAACASEPLLLAAHIATKGGLMRTFPWRNGWAADFDPRQRDWYVNAINTKRVAWTGPYISKSTNRQLVTCSAQVLGPSDVPDGVIKLDITPETINQAIILAQVGKNGFVFLMDGTGGIIASPRLDELRGLCLPAPIPVVSNLDVALRDPVNFQAVNLAGACDPALRSGVQRMLAQESGLQRCDVGQSPHYLAFAPVPTAGWSIGVVMPIDEIVAPARNASAELATATADSTHKVEAAISRSRLLLALLFAVALLLSGWAALLLARRITRPIHELSAGASELGAGRLDFQLSIRTGDEIEKLANDFNAMSANLRTYIANLGAATAARRQVESELGVATKIQSSLLPRIFPPFPDRVEFDLFASMDPAREVGGDFFDFFFIDSHRLCLAIGDVSDKGVPASLFMAVTKTLIKAEALQPGRSVAEVMARVNDQLCAENEMLMFVTVFIAVIDVRTGEFEFANAGHNPPVIGRADGSVAYMKPAKGVALAVMDGVGYKVGRERLGLGDLLFIYTDGVNEAMNMSREQFSYERLLARVTKDLSRPVDEITGSMRAAVSDFAGEAPQSDDITMISFRFKALGG